MLVNVSLFAKNVKINLLFLLITGLLNFIEAVDIKLYALQTSTSETGKYLNSCTGHSNLRRKPPVYF
jgi:hypothetical protein